jgi:hypothetical protein
MSYSTIAKSSNDQALRERVVAATVAEAWNNPAVADSEFTRNVKLSSANGNAMVYPVCVASDVEAAYASALAANNPNPGGDEGVVTDGMILANLQAKWPMDAPEA